MEPETELRRSEWEARKLQREREARELEHLRGEAIDLVSRTPPGFQDWGFTRTRAYLRLCAITKRKATLIKPPLDLLKKCISELKKHPTWSIERCAQLATTPETAKEI